MRHFLFRKISLGLVGLSLFFYLASGASAWAAVQSEVFYVDSYYDVISREQVTAELILESEKGYYYIESDFLNYLSKSQKERLDGIFSALAKEFDKIIYPKLTELLGNPLTEEGEDEKITLLFTQMISMAGGYFNPANQFPRANQANSNERKMIYLNTDYLFSERLKTYVAHEFQHLISYSLKEKKLGKAEDIWLNEMRSEYVSTYLGYDAENFAESNLKIRLDKFNQYSSDPLTEWQGKIYDYSSINLFGQYLADQYGPEIFSYTINNELTGIASVNQALKDLGVDKDFRDIFGDWLVALYLNDTSEEKIYGFLNPLLKNIKPSITATYAVFDNLIIERSGLTKDWMPVWYEILPDQESNNRVRLIFEGETNEGEFSAKILKIDSSGNYFVSDWSFTDGKKGEITIRHLGEAIKKVVVMPYLAYEGSYQVESLDYRSFKFKIESQKEVEPREASTADSSLEKGALSVGAIKDGDLVRATNDYRVYIIKGNYKRHIKSGRIFDFYNHLSWEKVKEVNPEIINQYQESDLVRADGDKKVYQISDSTTKHWLEMSSEAFESSGRNWASVYIINEKERDFYQTGNAIVN